MEIIRIPQPGGQCADVELIEEMRERIKKQKMSIRPTFEPQKRDKKADWEATALLGIQKKRLDLGVDWGKSTWTHKSTNHEKIKLLKDDGVDVTDLLSLLQGKRHDGKLSVTIVKAVAAHITACKQKPRRLQSVSQNFSSTADGDEDSQEGPSEDSPGPATALSAHKRNRSDETEEGSAWLSANLNGAEGNAPPAKKPRVKAFQKVILFDKMNVTSIATWDELKRHALAKTFQASPASSYSSSASALSRISITFPAPFTSGEVAGGLQLNSSGYKHIADELRILSEPNIKEGNTEIMRLVHPSLPSANAITVRYTCKSSRQTKPTKPKELTDKQKNDIDHGFNHLALKHVVYDGVYAELSSKPMGPEAPTQNFLENIVQGWTYLDLIEEKLILTRTFINKELEFK